MTTLVVPYAEVEKLITWILDRFFFQTGVRIERTDVDYSFITARQGMKLGFQLKNIESEMDRFFCSRTYIDFYDFLPNLSEFQKEEFENGGLGLGNEAYVQIALLPRSEFPGMSKIEGLPSGPGEPTIITIEVSDGELIRTSVIDFVPQNYDVYVGSDVTVDMTLTTSPDSFTQVTHGTQNGTAIASVDYTEVSDTETWFSGDEPQKSIRIPLTGNRGYYNWFTNEDDFSLNTYRTNTTIEHDGRHVFSSSLTDNANIYGGSIPLYQQQVYLASQYLENKARYYEFEVISPGGELTFNLQMNYYLHKPDLNDAVKYDTSVRMAYLTFGYYLDMGEQYVVVSTTNGSDEPFEYETEIADEDFFPARVHFLVDPEQGAKIGFNGKWANFNTNEFEDDVDQVPWWHFDSSEEDRLFWKLNFFVSGTKNTRIMPS